MKVFAPVLLSLQTLLVSEEKILSVPLYQRDYSWLKIHWEDFISTIIDFLENHKKNEICFMGEIILTEEKSLNSYNIIDGQQRLLTIFIFLISIWKRRSELIDPRLIVNSEQKIIRFVFDIDEKGSVEEKWEDISRERKLRLNLKGKDREEFENMIKNAFKKTEKHQKTQAFSSNIQNCSEWFDDWLEDNKDKGEYEITDILDIICSKLYFIKIELSSEQDVMDLFILLNTTGLNLGPSDIIKSLLIKQCKKDKPDAVKKKWDEKVIAVICSSRESNKIIKEMNEFLKIYLKVKFRIDLKGINIIRTFKEKLEGKENPFNADDMLEELIIYAEAYRQLKRPEKDYWESNWSESMYSLITENNLLRIKQLDPVIICLEVERKKNKITSREIGSVVESLKKIILYSFRANLVKRYSPIDLFNLIPHWLEAINRKRFSEEVEKSKLISNEFDEQEKGIFYSKLQTYQSKKNNNVYKYIFSRYYLKKDGEIEEMEKNFYKDTQVEHLLPKNPKEVAQKGEGIYFLGNITLIRAKFNKKQSNKNWREKREELNKLKRKCLLNLENNNPVISWSDNPKFTDIENRTIYLINDFKELGIFEL